MYDDVVTFEFPEGQHELRIGFAPPRLGDTIRRGGTEWVVASVESDVQGRIAIVFIEADRSHLDVCST